MDHGILLGRCWMDVTEARGIGVVKREHLGTTSEKELEHKAHKSLCQVHAPPLPRRAAAGSESQQATSVSHKC